MELLSPRITAPVLQPPSRRVLNMAFGVGAGAVLGDKSRYRSHGTIVTAAWADGLHGRCLDFDSATPDYVTIPAAHTQLNFTSEDFSIISRIKADAIVGAALLFGRGELNLDGYYLKVWANGQIAFETYQLAARQRNLSTIGDIVAGAWYTVGISRIGTVLTLFRNGVDTTTTAVAIINPATCARLAKIGIRDDLVTEPLDGKMEFLRIWRGIGLVASEHLAWHNALA